MLLVSDGHEAFGWRGYALPRLQRRYSPPQASWLVGLAWGFWHLPLFFVPPALLRLSELAFGPYLLAVVGMSVVFTWLYNAAGGAVLVPVLAHAGINAVSWSLLPAAQAAPATTSTA